jgi:hypothetical protein
LDDVIAEDDGETGTVVRQAGAVTTLTIYVLRP